MAPRERPAAAGAATAATESAPKPALFLIDDADGYGLADLRRLCDAAPFASDWAAMLSVHAVLVTRFAVPQLDFLQSRVAAVLSWPEPPEPLFAPGSASGLAGDFALGPVAADRVFADAIERARFAPALASVLQSLWQRARPADPRRCAMLGYVAAIGALAACFLALQSGGGVDWKAAFGLGP